MNKSPDEALNEYLDANRIDEDIIITNLLKLSARFKIFYEHEIKNMDVKREWIDNNRLGQSDPFFPLCDGDLAKGSKLHDEKWVIVVRNVPSSLTDETVIAHELAHIKINREGFPLTNIDPKFCNNIETDRFRTSLNNMIHDPLVIKKLKSYGYDLRREYIRDCQEGVKLLQKTYDQPAGIEEVRSVCDYVKNTLENEILFGNNNNACKKYNKIFGQKFGFVKVKGEKLCRMISEIGFENPDKVRRIYDMVIEKFGLSKFIYVEH